MITLRSINGQALTSAQQEQNIIDLDTRPIGQNYPSDPDIGITVGGEWSWKSIEPDIRLDGLGSDPSMALYQGNIRQLQFTTGNSISFGYTMPYDYILGTIPYIRMRWSHNSAIVTTGNVGGLLELTYAKGFNQGTFMTPIAMAMNGPASIIRYQNVTIEGPIGAPGGAGGLLDSTLFEPDGSFLASLALNINTMDGGALPFLHSIGLLYQSGIIGTKNKEPNFWA